MLLRSQLQANHRTGHSRQRGGGVGRLSKGHAGPVTVGTAFHGPTAVAPLRDAQDSETRTVAFDRGGNKPGGTVHDGCVDVLRIPRLEERERFFGFDAKRRFTLVRRPHVTVGDCTRQLRLALRGRGLRRCNFSGARRLGFSAASSDSQDQDDTNYQSGREDCVEHRTSATRLSRAPQRGVFGRVRQRDSGILSRVAPSLGALVGLLASSNSPDSLSGTFRWLDGSGRQREWRVWRQGRLARIEEPAGTVALVAGERTYWMFWPPSGGVVALPRSGEHDDFELSRLTMLNPERYWREWLSLDPSLVEATFEETVHDGRHAWRFTAPEVKGARSVLTVDCQTGLVLLAQHPDAGAVEEWSAVSTAAVDPNLFRWDGPWQRANDFSRRYPEGWQPE